MICISGTPTIMPKVTRSRDSWRTSFSATARRRRSELERFSSAMILAPRRDDEHVLETAMAAGDGGVNAMGFEQPAQLRLRVAGAAIHQHAQSQAELGDAMHPGQLTEQPRRIAAVGA